MDSSLRKDFSFNLKLWPFLIWRDFGMTTVAKALNVGIQEYYLRNSLIQILFLLSLVDF